MLKRSFSRKPSTSSSASDKLNLALVRRPQWISKVSLIPSMGICSRSSFSGSFFQFTIDTTLSDIGSDDHGEDPDDFQKKIQVLHNLDHPNLIKLYGYLENARSGSWRLSRRC